MASGADNRFAVHRGGAMAPEASNAPAAPAASNPGGWRSDDELEAARRAAFLGGSDSMAGLKAMRGLLSDEARNRGIDLKDGGPIPSIRFLEQKLAGARRAPDTANVLRDNAQFPERPEFAGVPSVDTDANRSAIGDALTAQPLSDRPVDSRLAASAVNAYLQSDQFKQKVRASQQPAWWPASWQSAPVAITAPRQEPGREAMLAAFGALGEQPLTTPGEAVLAVGAGNAFGTRGGQFKPGNTVNLGEIPKDKLPPRNSTGHYSGAAIGDLRGYQFNNPGNF